MQRLLQPGSGRLSVILDQSVYVSGQHCTGLVEFSCPDNYRARSILARLRAFEVSSREEQPLLFDSPEIMVWKDPKEAAKEARVHLEQHNQDAESFSSSSSPSQKSSAQELQDRVYLDEETHLLRKGTHVFPFVFELPEGLPTSFYNSKNYQMVYRIYVTVEHATHPERNITGFREINVVENLSGTEAEAIRGPSAPTYSSKEISGDRVQVVARINKDFYASGEPVFLILYVMNDTYHKLANISCKIRRYILHGDGMRRQSFEPLPKDLSVWNSRLVKRRTICRTTFSSQDHAILPFSKRHILLEVPTPPDAVTVNRCSTFSVEYVLHLSFDATWGNNLKLDLPLRFLSPASYNTIFFPGLQDDVSDVLLQDIRRMDSMGSKGQAYFDQERRQMSMRNEKGLNIVGASPASSFRVPATLISTSPSTNNETDQQSFRSDSSGAFAMHGTPGYASKGSSMPSRGGPAVLQNDSGRPDPITPDDFGLTEGSEIIPQGSEFKNPSAGMMSGAGQPPSVDYVHRLNSESRRREQL
eukprot:ANDGO_06812.mRNA.1 hypothetical protein CAOG_03562